MTHLDLRAATAKQVQQLRFVDFEVWFPPRRDDRVSEGFYTPLHRAMDRLHLPDIHMVVWCPLLTWFATASLSLLAKGRVGPLVTLLLLPEC